MSHRLDITVIILASTYREIKKSWLYECQDKNEFQFSFFVFYVLAKKNAVKTPKVEIELFSLFPLFTHKQDILIWTVQPKVQKPTDKSYLVVTALPWSSLILPLLSRVAFMVFHIHFSRF